VYRFLVLYALVFSALSAKNAETFHFVTTLAILFAALTFLICLDLVAIVGPKATGSTATLVESPRDAFYAKAFLLLYAIGWVWRAYALQAGLLHGTFLATQIETTEFGNLIGQLNGLSLLALMGRLVFVRSDRITLTMLALVAAEIAWAFMSGSKIAILYVIFPLLLVAYRRTWLRFSFKRALFGAAAALILVQISFGVVTAYRASVQQSVSSGEGLAISAVLNGIADALTGGVEGPQDAAGDVGGGLSDRLNWAGFFGVLIERDDIWEESWWGSSYSPIFTWWIPRFLWAEKPTISVGAWYGEQVLGWSGSRSEGAITIWGDGLMNFGFPGVLFASVAWILLIYFVYDRAGRRGRWGLFFLSAIYVKLLLGLEQNLAAPLVALQLQLLLIFVVRLIFDVSANLLMRRA